MPLFLEDEEFRNLLVSNVRYNKTAVRYWQKTFAEQRQRDKDAKLDAALTRIYILLSREYVRHVVGQTKTTVDLANIMQERKVVLLNLPAHLPEDDKRFLGTILISELLQATRKRTDLPQSARHQFCLFVDEFQNFATSRDFGALVTEGRKFGIATTIAHQERFGQFSEDRKIQGATSVSLNKIFFQLTVADAEELAPEFAKAPPTETKRDHDLVISQEPVADLLRRGHVHPKIQQFVNEWLRPWKDHILRLKDQVERGRLEKTEFQNDATLYRDEAAIYQVDARIKGATGSANINHSAVQSRLGGAGDALEGALSAHSKARDLSFEMRMTDRSSRGQQEKINNIDRFFISFMDGRRVPGPGKEWFAQFLVDSIAEAFVSHVDVLHLYIFLTYGDPDVPRSIPGRYLGLKYWTRQIEEMYLQQRRDKYDEHVAWIRAEHGDTDDWSEIIERSLKRDLMNLHKGQFSYFLDHEHKLWGQPLDEFPLYPHNKPPYRVPDLPARVFTADESEAVIGICRKKAPAEYERGDG